MSTAPIALAGELDTYLGTPGIDTVRATLILQLAQDLCETIATPLPDTAKGTVLDVAARAFPNPQNVTAESVGPFSVSHSSGFGGLYLSRANKATLRRLSGRGGAFSVDILPTGVSAVMSLTVTATAGTFRVVFAGASTAPIAFNAPAGVVQAAMEALGVIGAGNIAVTGTYLLTFGGLLATTPLPTITVDTAALTGTATTAVVAKGVLAPGQGLPSWDYDYYRSGHLLGQQIYGGGL
jgi:hypothetical protein